MADNPNSILDRVLGKIADPGTRRGQYNPLFSVPTLDPSHPIPVVSKLADTIDSGLYKMQQYAKSAGPLPVMPIQRVDGGAHYLMNKAVPAVQTLIQRYSAAPLPTAPALPVAPSYATDPEDKGKSMGIALQKPGGWY